MKKARVDEPKAGAVTPGDSVQRDEVVQLYKLQMPEDLFHLWEFCKELHPDDPCSMFCNIFLICFYYQKLEIVESNENFKDASNYHEA